jgi:hypothetical protein
MSYLTITPNIDVKLAITSNPNATDEMYSILAFDDYQEIRIKLARNDKVPRSIILSNLPNFKKEWYNSKHYLNLFKDYEELM